MKEQQELTLRQVIDRIDELNERGFNIHIEGKGDGTIKLGSDDFYGV